MSGEQKGEAVAGTHGRERRLQTGQFLLQDLSGETKDELAQRDQPIRIDARLDLS